MKIVTETKTIFTQDDCNTLRTLGLARVGFDILPAVLNRGLVMMLLQTGAEYGYQQAMLVKPKLPSYNELLNTKCETCE